MGTPLDDAALDVIFRSARTQNKWLGEPVSDEQLHTLYDLMRWWPTSANSFPLRIVFVKSPAAKERLKALVLAGNKPKVAAAPVTAILGYDTQFYGKRSAFTLGRGLDGYCWVFAACHAHGVSSPRRLSRWPLTRRVSTSVR